MPRDPHGRIDAQKPRRPHVLRVRLDRCGAGRPVLPAAAPVDRALQTVANMRSSSRRSHAAALALAVPLAGLLFSATLGACSNRAVPAPDRPAASAMKSPSCALGVPGARAESRDTPEGVELTFRMEEGDRRMIELRSRVHHAAEGFGPGARQGVGHDGKHRHGGGHGLKPSQLPPYDAVVEDVHGGALLRLFPKADADRDALRAKVHARADEMNRACDHDDHE